MKLTTIILLLSIVTTAQAQITSRVDSLNYAYGYFSGDGILQEIIAADTVDVKKVKQFADGYSESFLPLEGKKKLTVDAAYFLLAISADIKDNKLFGDSTITYNATLFNENLAKALNGKPTIIAMEECEAYIQKILSTPLAPTGVRSQSQVDSLNIAFAVFSARGVCSQILGADTTTSDVKAFLKYYKVANKKIANQRLYLEGLRVGRTMYQQVIGSKTLMGDTSLLPHAEIIKTSVLNAIYKDEKSPMTSLDAVNYLNDYVAAEKAKQLEGVVLEGARFLENNKKEKGMNVTPSGLQYFVNRLGTGERPTAQSTVKVHYEGYLINGKPFDSSVKRGEPLSFPLNGVIKGWTEGLQLMPVGSKFTFFIPFNLAYGASGAGGGVIPPYATLIFEIELLEIEK